jgi:hypothetical protein
MITSAIPKLPYIDKQTTIHFYTAQLGFTLTADYGDYLIMTKDAAELHFFAYPTLLPTKSDFMIYLRVDNNIHALYEQWKNTEPPIQRIDAPTPKPWGQIEMAIIDPNGTLLTFGQAM